MVRLSDLEAHSDVPALLKDLSRREGPNTIRNAATVGGTIASGDPESELVAGFWSTTAKSRWPGRREPPG